MKQIILFFKRDRLAAIGLTVLLSLVIIVVVVQAATTIGQNISTDGTLSVTGSASLSTASTTGDFWLGNQTADDDDFLYMDASSTEYLMWDDSPGQFQLSDDLLINGKATTSGYLVIGTVNPQNNMVAGDLLVGSNATTTGNLVILGGNLNKDGTALTVGGAVTLASTLTVNGATTLTGKVIMGAEASTTDFFVIGNSVANDDDYLYFDIGRNEYLAWDDSPGEFDLSDNLHISGNASTTGTFVSGGSLTVATTSATTTGQAFFGAPAGTATTTIIFGDAKGLDACLELWENGVAYRVYINGGSLVAEAGRCKD